MKARFGILAVLALLASSTGCTMCQDPFDYCNPMFGPNGCLNCDWGARRGSAFHPMADAPPANTVSAASAELPAGTGSG